MRLGVGDLLLVSLVAVVGPSVGFGVLSDPGLGWHLRVPDVVCAGGFPTADPFSDPPGRYWLANQWLGELPFWAGWKLAGWNGVAAVAVGLLLLTYRLLFVWLRADGVAWPVALGLCLLAAAAGYVGWLARPTMFTTLFTAVVVRTVVRFHDGRLTARRLLWLPPLFAVWVNCHGGFVAGLFTLGLAAGLELVMCVFGSPVVARSASEGVAPRWRFGLRPEEPAARRFLTLAAVGAGCTLATLANPYGWRVYPWVFGLLGDPFFMNLNGEWKSPDFHDPAAARFELLLLLTVGLLAVSRHRPNLVLVAASLFWLHQSLQGRRFTPIGVLVLTPLAGRLATGIEWVNAHPWVIDWKPLWGRELAGNWLGPLLALVGLVGWAAFAPRLTPDAPAVPEPVLRELLARWQPGEPVFHSPNHGGYLTLHGWPAFRTTIDDRNEVHGRARYEAYLATEAAAPGWEARLDEGRFAWVVAATGAALADRLAERPVQWRVEYADTEASLFRRR